MSNNAEETKEYHRKRMIKAIGKEVVIDGIKYDSVSQAQAILGLTYRQVRRRAEGYVVNEVSDLHREAIRRARKGKKLSDQTKAMIRDAQKRNWESKSEEEKESQVNRWTANIRDLAICPHCGIEAAVGNIAYHHGDNCKTLKDDKR